MEGQTLEMEGNLTQSSIPTHLHGLETKTK